MLNRRAVLLGLLALLCLGLAILWTPNKITKEEKPPALPTSPPAAPPPPAPRPGTPASPLPVRTVATAKHGIALHRRSDLPGRSEAEWRALLADLAPESYETRHPGRIAKLAELLEQHPEDPAWEAGTLHYLFSDIVDPDVPQAEWLALWQKAADALPSNPAISDELIRQTLTYGSLDSLRPEKLDALLKTQSERFPEDPHLLWLRASLAAKGGRNEEALAFLKTASALPPWEDWSGTARTSAVDVREALEGPQGALIKGTARWSTPTPDIAMFRSASAAQLDWAKTLLAQGDPARAREVLDQSLAMSRAMSQGARLMITSSNGWSMEARGQKDLQDLLTATGDSLGAEAATRRIAAIQADRQDLRQWLNQHSELWNSPALSQLRDLGKPPSEDQLRAADNLLTPEQKAFLTEHLQNEMKAFRTWQASQRPPAGPSSP